MREATAAGVTFIPGLQLIETYPHYRSPNIWDSYDPNRCIMYVIKVDLMRIFAVLTIFILFCSIFFTGV